MQHYFYQNSHVVITLNISIVQLDMCSLVLWSTNQEVQKIAAKHGLEYQNLLAIKLLLQERNMIKFIGLD